MRNKTIILAFSVLTILISECYGQRIIKIDSAKNSCFKILLYKNEELIKTGSGFVLSVDKSGERCICITNEHVLDGGDSAVIEFEDEKIGLKSVQYVSYKKDFVVFEIFTTHIKEALYKPSKLSDGKSNKVSNQIGEDVYTVSSPRGLINSVSNGIISSYRNINGINFIQFTAPVSPGSSGGALFNENGNLIGLVSSQYSGGQNLNFAEDINEILYNLIHLKGSLESYNIIIGRLEDEKISSNPFLREIDSLVKINMALAYEKMQENPELINNNDRLLFLKMSYETINHLYLNSLSTASMYYERNGINPLLAINLIEFRNEIDSEKLSNLNYSQIIEFINNQFLHSPDIAPFLDLILGTCEFKISNYYSAINYLNEYESFMDTSIRFDDKNQKTNYTLLDFYFSYGYEIIGFSYFKLENYKLAIDNLIKCLNSKEGYVDCNVTLYLISAFVEDNDSTNACSYYNKYKGKCSSFYGYNFQKQIDNYCK